MSEQERLAVASEVRGKTPLREALYELDGQVAKTLGAIRAGFIPFSSEKMAEVLTDRELATLELWAGKEDEAIHAECERRRGEYEKFTRRFAPREATSS